MCHEIKKRPSSSAETLSRRSYTTNTKEERYSAGGGGHRGFPERDARGLLLSSIS